MPPPDFLTVPKRAPIHPFENGAAALCEHEYCVVDEGEIVSLNQRAG